ncbi:MAG TPA: methyltransferase domain-containing protein [Planctomycetaceae bacterium]|nr:methyltransferase domain-containing protein [Planctomycetaceae bacterium]
MMSPVLETVEKASLSRGTSANVILRRVAEGLDARRAIGGTLVDLGCGTGDLWRVIGNWFDEYLGVDAVRYAGLPAEAQLLEADLDAGCPNIPDASADVVASIETIEHLENPRAFVRTAARIVKPGGWVVLTTPNQLSLLSKVCLLCSNQYPAFKERPGLYPSHITALLSIDLVRMATEVGLDAVQIVYSQQGRVPLTGRHFPQLLSRWFPRALSDNVLLFARKPIVSHERGGRS